MKFENLQKEVIEWAEKKDLLKLENAPKQFMKFAEESGELSKAILKNNHLEAVDGFGDVLVTLIILSEQLGYDLTECLEVAYNEIKNREGETVNGIFIKK
ncbi:MAG: MazG-like family protein [Saprospiraceae bacterium]